jgi:uncharacterized protein (DUF342 family)
MSEFQYAIEHYLTLTLSDDKTVAYLQMTDMSDSFQISVDQLTKFLESQKIVHGINYEKLSLIAREPKNYMHEKVIIAAGDLPHEGKDGYINYLYDSLNKKKPEEYEDGSVDLKEMNNINNVLKGQILAERVLAEEGKPGKAVTGEALFAKAGKEARFKVGKNVVVDAENMKMYAAIDGLVATTDRDKINVFPVYEVNGDVDYNVGNIDFVGTVVIRGNVLNGFRVKASGDIRVVGGVEGAELIAEGSIEITAGILAHHKGIVKAGKNVKSSFIQEGNVEAGEDVLVSQSIMHSTVRAAKNVICSGTKGLIVGGIVQAGERVTARTVGNTMSTPTIIEVGVLPELRNELVELRQKIREHNEGMEKTDKALTILNQMASIGQLSGDKLAMRIKLNNTKKQSIDELGEMKERILEIEKTLEDIDLARVDVGQMIYGGCKVVIGRYTRFVKDPISRISFKIMDGDVALVQNV